MEQTLSQPSTIVRGLVAACVPGWADRPPVATPYRVRAVLGEGVGPEVVGAAVVVLDAVRTAFDLDIAVDVVDIVGGSDRYGRIVDQDAAAFFEEAFAEQVPVLCGPVGGRFVYELRAKLGLYCKLVPVRPLEALADASIVRPERLCGADVLIVRENDGGLYQGAFGRRDGGRTAFQEAQYSQDQVDRILIVAERAAAARNGRLAVVTKPGGIPAVSDLWRERAEAIEGGPVEIEHLEVDNACYQLVADPHRFDVVVAPNMLGDVVADSAAVILGSRGMALSANFGAPGRAVFQTGHGAARDLAGRGVANPVAQVQSLAMLLRESLDLPVAALAVERAVEATLRAGVRTADIAGPTSTVVGTAAMADAIATRLVADGRDHDRHHYEGQVSGFRTAHVRRAVAR
jgi:3-isopropylmalate dehydrogenase